MDTPEKKITKESQIHIWERFELSIQEFRSDKEKRDSEFQAKLDELHNKVAKLMK
jgi:hypothetical protein